MKKTASGYRDGARLCTSGGYRTNSPYRGGSRHRPTSRYKG